mmetsp:Transcript_9932/g.14517  ORF Transcript_9932/g.14517 Transcript_9932/m.14517 type:complete len:366 (+) Transcript_9932:202-1299(+)
MASSSFPREECFSSVYASNDPSSYAYYDHIYSHLKSTFFASSIHKDSVEIVPPQTFPHTSTDDELALLHIMGLSGFTVSRRINGTVRLLSRDGNGIQAYSTNSGFVMGVHHFNNGIGSVVPQIEGINRTCPIRLVHTMYDTESSQTIALDTFSRVVLENSDRRPGAVFGAWRSAVSIPLAVLTGTRDIPQFSPLSTSTELDDTAQYPLFSRVIPSDAGTARAAVAYFRNRLDVSFLGVLYVNDAYGSAFHQAIREAAAEREEGDQIEVKGYTFSYNENVDFVASEIELAIKQLKESRFRVFFGVFYGEHYDIIMNYAYDYGIVGPEYLWIISDGVHTSYFQNKRYDAGLDLEFSLVCSMVSIMIS